MDKSLIVGLSALALSGCVGGSASDRYVRGDQTGSGFVSPRIQQGDGLGGVIGASARDLSNQFGDARIDLVEGDARKLQYAAPSCILDVYLYPLEAGGAPVATHVEARARQGGGAVDAGQCITAVSRAAAPQ